MFRLLPKLALTKPAYSVRVWRLRYLIMSMQNLSLETPERVPQVFADAWNARDPDRLAAVFETDPEFVNVTGLWWHDREAIRRAHAYGLKRIFNRSHLSVVTVRVKRLTPDIAVVHVKMRLTGQTPAPGIAGPQPRTTIFSFVVRRTSQGLQGCVVASCSDRPRTTGPSSPSASISCGFQCALAAYGLPGTAIQNGSLPLMGIRRASVSV
jgi:uncharacterized protein (TIGR02246 family)